MDLLRVGAFEFYPSERRLCRAGVALEIGARAFDLLLVLAESPGRLVTKATLLERVWPKLVVDENNLPAQIASLRRILGAGAIGTVPGFGYRLELAVAAEDTTVAAAAPAAASAALPRLPLPPRGWPARLANLVGRDPDVTAVEGALGRACLVSVVGGAGVGKTRLAEEIIARAAPHAKGATAWVSLGSLQEARHVPSAIAIALGLTLPDGRDGFTALTQLLEEVPVLLVLDGAEHLAEVLAPSLAALVARTRGVRLLVTSQAPLGIAGELVFRLASLAVPEPDTPPDEVSGYAAVALFAARATAADRRFALGAGNASQVGAICRRLDGNPLALELAAARVPSLGVSGLLERLDDRFRLLKLGGAGFDPRHGTLRAAFEWSHGLLTPAEQRVFNRLGAFAGSFSLEAAARAVADAETDTADAIDLIGRLVDRSLVTALPGDPPRYALLETARLYALGRLKDSGNLDAARRDMAGAMLHLLDAAYDEYWSLDEAIWVARYAAELANVRAALDWSLPHDKALAVALYGSAWPLFAEMELFAEARRRYEQVVRLLSDTLPRARLGRFWEAVATYDSTRQCDRARYAAEIAASMHSAAGDVRGRYYALMLLALNWRGDQSAARAAYASAAALEDPAWPARLLTQGALADGALHLNAAQYAEARTAYRRAVRLALTVSERQALAATVNIVELDVSCGDTAAALQLGRPLALSLRHSTHRATRFDLLAVVFGALVLAGKRDEARAIGGELYDLAMRLDASRLFAVLDAMALLAASEARYETAARVLCSADLAHAAHGEPGRRPVEARMRAKVSLELDERLGRDWREVALACPPDEAGACALALGLSA